MPSVFGRMMMACDWILVWIWSQTKREEEEGWETLLDRRAQTNAFHYLNIRESADKCHRRLPSLHPRHETQSRTHRWPLTFGLLQLWGQRAVACAPDHQTTMTKERNVIIFSCFHCEMSLNFTIKYQHNLKFIHTKGEYNNCISTISFCLL